MSNTVRFTLVLTIVCLAAGGGLGGVYLLTQEPIAVKAYQTEGEVRRAVLPDAKEFREVEESSAVYAGVAEDGAVVGYVAVGEARGYGGKLEVMVGLTKNLAVVKAAVLTHNETPGLGAECARTLSEDTLWTVLFGGERTEGTSWMDQFAGKRKAQLGLGSGIDARTGCTITSKAVVEAAKAAIETVERALKDPQAGGTNEAQGSRK